MNYTECISIIVPVYNCEKYIGKCIKSIQKQTYSNWNLILVDDGSTDGSGTICDRFAAKDGRISVVHQENRGLIGARKTGIANASGEFVSFVDADDMIEPEMFQKMMETQVQYLADIVCCGYRTLSRRGWIKGRKRSGCDSATITSGKDESVRMAATTSLFTMWGKLYRRNIFQKAQDMLETIPNVFWCEDSLINTVVFNKADKVVWICDEFYEYRIGGGSSNCSEKTMREMAEVYQWRKNYLLTLNADTKYHRTNITHVLNTVVYYAYTSKKLLSREKICFELASAIEDMEQICPDFWRKDAFNVRIPMTDEEFKNIHHESPLVVIKQMILRIF